MLYIDIKQKTIKKKIFFLTETHLYFIDKSFIIKNNFFNLFTALNPNEPQMCK